MKTFNFTLVLSLCSYLSAATQPTFTIDKKIHDQSHFIEHSALIPGGSYLAKNLPFTPIDRLRKAIEKSIGMKLKNRQEAHITVISPNEFAKIKSKLSIAEINQMAKDKIQAAKFRILCLGQGKKLMDSKNGLVYFVVVHSDALMKVRREIAKKFYDLGGDKSDFDPTVFYPHITVGFSKRDLHPEDGVVKDVRSCAAKLQALGLKQAYFAAAKNCSNFCTASSHLGLYPSIL